MPSFLKGGLMGMKLFVEGIDSPFDTSGGDTPLRAVATVALGAGNIETKQYCSESYGNGDSQNCDGAEVTPNETDEVLLHFCFSS